MSVRFELDPAVTPEVRDGICALWADVSNAGGAVGFVPPVTSSDIRPDLVRHLAALAEGRERLIVGRDADGRIVANAFLTLNWHRMSTHWLWVYTVMVHPSLQGCGVGRALMAAVSDAARGIDGVIGLRLTCRGGTGLRRFYQACGYREIGRAPRAIKLADDDFRDDVTMWLDLV
ncbi:GNAT family N-acetyltransferase [Streptomyces noursei]|uniref:GNAT family N-acetyltransferase n=1 Tax=Streptomyces noursei TaxID=1971 RepID=UPI001672F9C4|nr:GNAT family N-acetyltransferase [Streptomyces noursei]MCZ1016618.1 GNAT family N-acetyltransferase [Streptomyces noursei]GGW98405.1 N-acetyltransferase [Streptomyces noursei]